MNKYVIGLVVTVAIFLGGYYTGKGQARVEIQEKIVREKGEKEIVIRDKIITVTKIQKPDGTIEETTKTEDKQSAEKSKSSSTEKDKVVVSTPILSKYSLGLKYWASIDDKLDEGKLKDKNKYEVTAGYRALGEIWVVTGFKLDKSVAVGLQLQF
jgi:hypothetical protein